MSETPTQSDFNITGQDWKQVLVIAAAQTIAGAVGSLGKWGWKRMFGSDDDNEPPQPPSSPSLGPAKHAKSATSHRPDGDPFNI